MTNTEKYFGYYVFDDNEMKRRLSEETYLSFKEAKNNDKELNLALADELASAMKNWAISLGATHYTHWFQPMTERTAEKHESFLNRDNDGSPIMEFSGKELIKGEPDGSSLPSGGLRTTFEARGYTIWDSSSYAFIKSNTLCIPTAFCSFNGEALDKKTPLLRSMRALNQEALKVLHLLGHSDVKHVGSFSGAEQEYFLIDKDLYEKREDLVITGKTLFGALPPKTQELSDHYYGVMQPKVKAFMAELDKELWKLGIYAKTEHKEVAPLQHELASLYSESNIATDQNQLVMEMMQEIATKYNLVCILREKPFSDVNGSGKHNNWSLNTDTGLNLMSMGKTEEENLLFMLFLSAVLKGTDNYQDLLRLSIASAQNDDRLGGHEAPPSIVSIYLGDDLISIFEEISKYGSFDSKKKGTLKLGANALPDIKKDYSDRNRTSPFAYTGNKFEFRMVGSSQSIADTNTVINTIVSESLREFSNRLEKAKDKHAEVLNIIKDTYNEHKRIIFSGNGYDDLWVKEAKKRGLLNLKSTIDALPYFLEEKNIKLFEAHNVLSKIEMDSRYEILLENYIKSRIIECKTLIDISRRELIPCISKYIGELCNTINLKKSLNLTYDCEAELVKKINSDLENINISVNKISSFINENALEYTLSYGKKIVKTLLPYMEELRKYIDDVEPIMPKSIWPVPTYEELFFKVN